jgi:hypothetical protein
MIASSQFSNLQLGSLATWQFGNLATWQFGNLERNAELTFNFGNFQFWQLSFWQLSILATFNFGNFHFINFISSISFNFTLPISFYQNLSIKKKNRKCSNITQHQQHQNINYKYQLYGSCDQKLPFLRMEGFQ